MAPHFGCKVGTLAYQLTHSQDAKWEAKDESERVGGREDAGLVTSRYLTELMDGELQEKKESKSRDGCSVSHGGRPVASVCQPPDRSRPGREGGPHASCRTTLHSAAALGLAEPRCLLSGPRSVGAGCRSLPSAVGCGLHGLHSSVYVSSPPVSCGWEEKGARRARKANKKTPSSHNAAIPRSCCCCSAYFVFSSL